MTAVAATLLLLTIGGFVLRGRSAAAGPPSSAVAKTDEPETLEVAAQGDDVPTEPSPSPEPSATPDGPPVAGGKLVVHVTGAVNRPGVYTLHLGDRLYHAVRAAGGFKPNARQDALNLADAVRDADQIHVPTKQAPLPARNETPARGIRLPPARLPAAPPAQFIRRGSAPYATIVKRPGGGDSRGRVLGVAPVPVVGAVPPADSAEQVGEASSPSSTKVGGSPESVEAGTGSTKFKTPGEGTIDLNTATPDDLQRLPGVGPSTAQRILEYRQEIGKFTDAKQLMDVKGIGEKKFAKMQPFVIVR